MDATRVVVGAEVCAYARVMDMLSPYNCVSFNLRKAARAVTQAYDDALKPVGLRSTQATILMVLADRGPLPMTALADVLVMDRTTLTRNLKPLIKDGLVTVGTGDDKRRRQAQITDAGRERAAAATPLWAEAQSVLVAKLGQARYQRLIGDLQATVSAIQSKD